MLQMKRLVFFKYQHLVPCNLRVQGLEPVNVIGDGNCFYIAIAFHLSKDEKQWAHVKFECLKYGILNLDTIIAKVYLILQNLFRKSLAVSMG